MGWAAAVATWLGWFLAGMLGPLARPTLKKFLRFLISQELFSVHD